MSSTKWIVLLIVILIGTNLMWVYFALNNGVTTTYQSDELGHQKKAIDFLAVLVTELPRTGSTQDISSFLRSRFPDEIVKTQGDTIEVGNMTLLYEYGKLVRVSPF